MQTINLEEIEFWYAQNFQKQLKGLRILFDDIEPLIKELPPKFDIQILGYSSNDIPIYKISIGTGTKKILIWSQMHGNESTGTKAVFDLFNFLADDSDLLGVKSNILKKCTIVFIPMLNPDGAINYTRENAVGIDLNRDAVGLKAIESNLLRSLLDEFKPHFCFNLHDQRTIFNVEGTKKPATISFLAPSEEITRKVTVGRTETMSVIVAMNRLLQLCIPNQVGKYTDEYYPTATGDNFQKLGHNTILIEAGHFHNDYEREVTRKYNFFALLQGLHFLAESNNYSDYNAYFDIPKNDKKYFDIIYRNALITENSNDKIQDIGILYKYNVSDNEFVKYNSVEEIGDLSLFYGHQEKDLNCKPFLADN